MQLVSRKPAEVAPPRMGPLAKLPVFLDLAGKRVVVAGASPPAVWKAELAAAAGANVEIYAPELSEEMSQLIARGAQPGSFAHHATAWIPDILDGADLALCAAEDEEEARAFWDAARARGVLVNVIDRAAYCQFQMGSIVNRSPVVIGISTDGAAPILAQGIRRRIETLLPPSLAAWAALAKRLRAPAHQRLAPGAQRRAFWERLAERAFGPPPSTEAEADARAAIAEISRDAAASAGRVTLVGAGPGDAELLTLKALRALQSADVVLFDDLVSPEVLELARREAKRMLVGKRGRRESCSQADINALMIKLARQGKHVVRLKSGDPMIFGRAGEEIAELEAQGIAVSVVPGITAGIAMAAALGCSLTHRDHAHSIRFVTGHARNGELPVDVDWRGLADPQTTLVLYMAGRTAPLIAARLIAHGLDAQTPAVVVTGLTRPGEQRWCGTLLELQRQELRPSTSDPVLIGIGRAFSTAAVTALTPADAATSATGGRPA